MDRLETQVRIWSDGSSPSRYVVTFCCMNWDSNAVMFSDWTLKQHSHNIHSKKMCKRVVQRSTNEWRCKCIFRKWKNHSSESNVYVVGSSIYNLPAISILLFVVAGKETDHLFRAHFVYKQTTSFGKFLCFLSKTWFDILKDTWNHLSSCAGIQFLVYSSNQNHLNQEMFGRLTYAFECEYCFSHLRVKSGPKRLHLFLCVRFLSLSSPKNRHSTLLSAAAAIVGCYKHWKKHFWFDLIYTDTDFRMVQVYSCQLPLSACVLLTTPIAHIFFMSIFFWGSRTQFSMPNEFSSVLKIAFYT